MSDNKTKILIQVAVLAVAVGVVLAVVLIKSGYKSQDPEPTDPPDTFTISDDGRVLNDTLNGFALTIPDLWVAVDSDIPNLFNLKPETANVACGIEVAHGTNSTGSSATAFLSYYDPGNRDISRTRDSLYELRDIQGIEAAYLAWTEEKTNVRKREVYIPYQGYVLTMRYWEDISPDKVGQQPVPCVRTFDDLVEAGVSFP